MHVFNSTAAGTIISRLIAASALPSLLLLPLLLPPSPALAEPLNSDYRISGDSASALRQVFDDGKRTYFETATLQNPPAPRRLHGWRGKYRVALKAAWQTPYWVVNQVADRWTMTISGRTLDIHNLSAPDRAPPRAHPPGLASAPPPAQGAPLRGPSPALRPGGAPRTRSASNRAVQSGARNRALAHCAHTSRNAATATAGASAGAAPIRDPKRAHLWELRAGLSLRENLAHWAAQAGWCFQWQLAWNYEIPAGAVLRGAFSGADGVVALLIGKYRQAPVPLQAHFAHGNRTLVIAEARYRNGDQDDGVNP